MTDERGARRRLRDGKEATESERNRALGREGTRGRERCRGGEEKERVEGQEV